MGFIDQQGRYYEGDRTDWRDTEVPQRPDHTYKWDGKEWVVDDVIVKAIEVEEAKAKLTEIDLKSIRAIREYITGDVKTKETAIIFLSERETEAQIERGKIVPIATAEVIEKEITE